MKVVFLGTGAMQPTKERGLSSIYVQFEKEHILIDCGEGTQRQMKFANLKAPRLTKIFISHFHADHVLGLSGIIRTLGANQYTGTLEIYGPKDLTKYFENMKHSAHYTENIKVNLTEITKDGKIFEDDKHTIEVKRLDHSTHCYGISITEKPKRKININYTKKFGLTEHPLLGELQKGKTVTYKGKKITPKEATILVKGKKLTVLYDTGYCDKAVELAKDSDLLISEATFLSKEEDKAAQYKHLTAKQAAQIAKKAKAKELILTHFSQRYKDSLAAKEEASKIFKNTKCAEDFMEINV